MKKVIFTLIVLVAAGIGASAQNNVGINTITPAATAALDVTSTTQGILVPRVTTTQRLAIGLPGTPANGLMVYDITVNAFYFFNGTGWKDVSKGGVNSMQNVLSTHGTVITGIGNYMSPLTTNNLTSISQGSVFMASENTTLTMNVSSYVGSGMTLELYLVAPSQTALFTLSGSALTSVTIGSWSSGAPATGTLVYSLNAGSIYTIKVSPSIAAGIYFTSATMQ